MRSKDYIEISIPQDFRFVTEAYEKHVRTTSRFWIACITLSLIAASLLDRDRINIIGVELGGILGTTILLIASCVVYFNFCSGCIQLTDSATAHQRLASKYKEELNAGRNSLENDILYSGVMPFYDRMDPISNAFSDDSDLNRKIYRAIKPAANLIFVLLPVLGILFFIAKLLDLATQIGFFATIFAALGSTVVLLVSGLAAYVVLRRKRIWFGRSAVK